MHLYEHVLNGNCFGGLGSTCHALSAHHTPQQLGTKLINDINLLLLNDPVLMQPESREAKLQAFSAALGLVVHMVSHYIPLSEVGEYLRVWSSCFFIKFCNSSMCRIDVVMTDTSKNWFAMEDSWKQALD